MLGRAQVEAFAGFLVGFLLEFCHTLCQFLAVLAQCAGVDHRAPLLHAGQYWNQWQVDIFVHFLQPAGFFQLRTQHLVQSQGDIGVFCGVGASLLQINLVEGQLLGAFAGDGFESDGLLAQVLHGQRVHVVTRPYGIEHVGLQHGVFRNAFQMYAMIGQHVLVVFEVLAELGFLRVFQQWFQLIQHCVPVQLFRGAHIIVAKWHVGSLVGLNGK